MLKRTMLALAFSLLAQPASAQGLVMVRDISYDMGAGHGADCARALPQARLQGRRQRGRPRRPRAGDVARSWRRPSHRRIGAAQGLHLADLPAKLAGFLTAAA